LPAFIAQRFRDRGIVEMVSVPCAIDATARRVSKIASRVRYGSNPEP
jgi:hypothetical protein